MRLKIFTRRLLKSPFDIAERLRPAELLMIGCSAGGFNLVFDLIVSLPANFPLPVIVVIHRSRKYKSSIEELLQQKARVKVKIAEDKERLEKGCVYFAPPDYHLLVEPERTLAMDVSEPVFYCRPAIDVTFQSASDVYLNKVIAILLSGANEDGAEGMAYVQKNKGITVIQDPAVAEVKTMPAAALKKCRSGMVLNDEQLFELVSLIALIK